MVRTVAVACGRKQVFTPNPRARFSADRPTGGFVHAPQTASTLTRALHTKHTRARHCSMRIRPIYAYKSNAVVRNARIPV